MSPLRVTRKACDSTTSRPGNRAPRWARTMDSSGTMPPAGAATSRGREDGHSAAPRWGGPTGPLGSRTARLSRRSPRWGNEWPGARVGALGVRTGATFSANHRSSDVCSAGASSLQSRIRAPSAASASATVRKQRYWRATSGRSRIAIASSCSAGVRPSGERSTIPRATWCFRDPTSTMKNWSRLVLKIVRRRSRASSGDPGSSANARTRALNSSADRRLLMNWSAAGRAASSVFAGSVGTRSSLNVSRLVSSVVPRLAGEFSTSGAADHSGTRSERAATASADSVTASRHDPEQPHPPFHVPEHAPHGPAARFLTASVFQRQPQRGTAAPQRQAPVRDRDHGGLPGDGRGGSAERGDALEPIGRRARHTIALLDRPCESCRRDHAPRPAPCRELVELVRAALRALPRCDDVVREHELGYQNERETRRTHPPLDLELDLRREAAGLDDRAQPARRLRVATEDVTRLELE